MNIQPSNATTSPPPSHSPSQPPNHMLANRIEINESPPPLPLPPQRSSMKTNLVKLKGLQYYGISHPLNQLVFFGSSN
ncbi:hypothetical protein AYI68_g2840 [Smittium mucronatum]|uniref:Uncharacterized protein n=1 Tax=Smittium mucronatum TaxID=133383 RepID=A0A1R0H1L5_9FUNG|nr:hypothetical protein AYI68_g2840 [Smittium mucronatum]